MSGLSIAPEIVTASLALIATVSAFVAGKRKNNAESATLEQQASRTSLETALLSLDHTNKQIDILRNKLLAAELAIETHGIELEKLRIQNAGLLVDNNKMKAVIDGLRRMLSEVINATRIINLFEASGEGICIQRYDRRIEIVNKTFCEMFDLHNVEPEDLEGVYLPEEAEKIKYLLGDTLAHRARVDKLFADWELVVDEELILTNGKTYLRTFVPIQHDKGHKEVLWVFKHKQ